MTCLYSLKAFKMIRDCELRFGSWLRDNCIIAYGIWLTDPEGPGGDDAVACLRLGHRVRRHSTWYMNGKDGSSAQELDRHLLVDLPVPQDGARDQRPEERERSPGRGQVQAASVEFLSVFASKLRRNGGLLRPFQPC